jgi:hypothetical protein
VFTSLTTITLDVIMVAITTADAVVDATITAGAIAAKS